MGIHLSTSCAPTSSMHRKNDASFARIHVTRSLKPGVVPSGSERITLKSHLEIRASKHFIDAGGVMPVPVGTKVLSHGHPHGFIHAATHAFANHFPLAVRPQHIWLMILQGVATHVRLNADLVRAKWVKHDGKKELVVDRPSFVRGKKNDWAGVVSGFNAQISNNVVDGVMPALAPSFCGTTAAEKISMDVTVMDVTKSFFSYKCMTLCGFPEVHMEGSLEDWQTLRQSAESLLGDRCEREFSARWARCLLPLLDRFIAEYRRVGAGGVGAYNSATKKFWNSMVKRGGTSGSGSRTWFNGWVNILFPYIKDNPNRYMEPYSPSNGYVKEGTEVKRYNQFGGLPAGVQGPDCEDFPSGLAKAPVMWKYLGSEVHLSFKAGFVGASQDDHRVVRAEIAWFITEA